MVRSLATLLLSTSLSCCVSAPIAPPPLVPGAREIGAVGVSVYDTADAFSPFGGAQAFTALHIGPLDVGGALQLSAGDAGPRFLGGGLTTQLRLYRDEALFVAAAVSLEYIDAFVYWRDDREPSLVFTTGVPVAFAFSEQAWVWVRPAVGAASEASLYASASGIRPAFGPPLPAFRLSYGASYDLGFVVVYGESSTSLPFGGAYLCFGLAVPI